MSSSQLHLFVDHLTRNDRDNIASMAFYGTGDNAQVSLLTLGSHGTFSLIEGRGHFMRQRRLYILLTSWAILLRSSSLN